MRALGEAFGGSHLRISLPSLRIETVSVDLVEALRGSRGGNFTLAPEAATENMRAVLNKPIAAQQLIETVREIYSRKWTTVKLYFMIGHPRETADDVRAIAELARAVLAEGRRVLGRRAEVHAGVGTLIPKAHTPFQWMAMDAREQIQAKQDLLRRELRGPGLKLDLTPPEVSLFEARLARGDRRMGAVIERAWKNGARFDAWTERFQSAAWNAAFEEAKSTRPSTPSASARRTKFSRGITSTWECARTICAANTKRAGGAHARRLPRGMLRVRDPHHLPRTARRASGGSAILPDGAPEMNRTFYRIEFAKTEAMRYTGHLDLQRAWERLLRRAGIPIAYSSGFHPHPRIQIGAALPLGAVGGNELVDIETSRACDPDETARALNGHTPPGMRIVRVEALAEGAPGLEKIILAGDYSAEPIEGAWPEDLPQRIEQLMGSATLPRERRGKTYDLRPRILTLALDGNILRMRLSLLAETTGRPDEVLAALGAEDVVVDVKRERIIMRDADDGR